VTDPSALIGYLLQSPRPVPLPAAAVTCAGPLPFLPSEPVLFSATAAALADGDRWRIVALFGAAVVGSLLGDAVLYGAGRSSHSVVRGTRRGDGTGAWVRRHLHRRPVAALVATRLLPVVVGPTWLRRHMQPVALDDLLHYLVAVTDLDDDVNRGFDVGGPDVMSYRELLEAHAHASGRRRPPALLFPVLLPHTFSLVVGTLAPGSSSLNAALVHSLSLDMVCTEHDLEALVGPPEGGPTGVEEALRRANA